MIRRPKTPESTAKKLIGLFLVISLSFLLPIRIAQAGGRFESAHLLHFFQQLTRVPPSQLIMMEFHHIFNSTGWCILAFPAV